MTEQQVSQPFCTLLTRIAWLLVGGLSLLLAASTRAVEIKIHGTLIENPPCSINNDQRVDIEFGDAVRIKQIDGVNYLQRKAITVSCTEDPGAGLRVRLRGTASDFDNTALSTSVNGLGVRFKLNEQALNVNSTLDIHYPEALELSAVPVKQPGADLKAGEFDASASLLLEYQ